MVHQATGNSNLSDAKKIKNDEFYTQYHDIEKEINAYLDYNSDIFKDKIILLPCDDPEWSNFTMYFAENFERFGLKKLISTSYAPVRIDIEHKPSKFEIDNPNYDSVKSINNGKVFTLTRDVTGNGRIDYHDLEWTYLKGDGDFRSREVIELRNEADIIITNPPFSLFREFLAWIEESDKNFLILGNMNAITYKEVFPLIKGNNIWLGVNNGAKEYNQPDGTTAKMGNTIWFTNMEHSRRHDPLQLMTMDENIRYSKHLFIREAGYPTYKDYDAIEVAFTNSIPSDYEGIMGVPISFLNVHNPEQYKILDVCEPAISNEQLFKYSKFKMYTSRQVVVDGIPCQRRYHRLLIKKI